MPRVFWGEAFAFEDAPRWAPQAAQTISVRWPSGSGAAEHGAGHGVVKGRPAASGVELVARAVERCAATPAGIGSVGLMVPVAPAERRFRRAVGDDLFFVGSEGSLVPPCVISIYDTSMIPEWKDNDTFCRARLGMAQPFISEKVWSQLPFVPLRGAFPGISFC